MTRHTFMRTLGTNLGVSFAIAGGRAVSRPAVTMSAWCLIVFGRSDFQVSILLYSDSLFLMSSTILFNTKHFLPLHCSKLLKLCLYQFCGPRNPRTEYCCV